VLDVVIVDSQYSLYVLTTDMVEEISLHINI